ncbi:MAG: N-acetylmuramoyl-L-alanine amidase [Stackebrandtia sp.]
MRGFIAAAFGVLIVLLGAPAAYADPGGKGDDRGEADLIEPGPPTEGETNYGDADWSAADSSNYTAADRPDSHPIDTVVIHTMQGSYEGTMSWFQNPKSDVTTHYVMRAEDGKVTQMVHESDIAWHAGNWDVNTESVGIEHEGFVDEPEKWYTDTVYEASARLVRDICARYDIPMDREHIIAHSEVPDATHTDPGSGWDWDKYMDLIEQADAEANAA